MLQPKRRFLWLVVAALTTALAVPAAADTTGKLSGTTVGPDGQPLPGVSVTIESPALIGGPRTAVTGADGTFNFPALPPGVYTLRAELDGFVAQERRELEVRLDRATQLAIEMASATVTEEIVVSAETPVVDGEQVSISQTFSNDYLSKAAVGSTNRSYQNILGNAAGVVTSGGNPLVFGSTIGESAFLIDGVDTTDPVTATFGTNFNYDAIEEISFLTAGFEAQYGRATGGVVNLITKSGGNEFSGTVDVRYAENGFNENGDHFDRDENETEFTNPTATLGGPIVRERAWFFTSGEWVDSRLTPTESPTTRKFEGINYLGKVTWQINPSWQAVVKVSGEDSDIDNSDTDRTIAAEATTFQEQATDIVQADVSGILSQRDLWDFKAALYRAELNAFPQSGDLETPGHIDFFTGEQYINAFNAQFSDRDRDELATSYTRFAEGFLGSHELKAGVEYADLFFNSHNFTTANGLLFQDADREPFVLLVSPDAGPVESDGTLQTIYLQDAWQPRSNVTLKLGLRYDQVAFDNNDGTEIADLAKLQPRVGLAWDIRGDGKNVARLAWGQFMHPNALTLPNFARTANSPFAFYLSCSAFVGDREFCESFAARPPLNANGFTFQRFIDDPTGFDPLGWILTPANLFGSAPNTIDPDLDPMYNEQIVVGFERELGPRTSVELSYIDKDTEDLFEDTCNGNLLSPSDPAACDFFVMANLPQLRRDYRGAILRFESRATDWLHLLASYVYSKSRASVEYNQNAGSDFDHFPEHFVNRYGYAFDDRRHRVKVNGYVDLPWDLLLGFDAFWSSEPAYSVTRAAEEAGYGLEFVESRGSRRGADNYQLDVELRKGWEFGGVRMALIGTVFNLLDSERPIEFCGTVDGCGEGLPLDAVTEYQQPRNYEVGIRFEF